MFAIIDIETCGGKVEFRKGRNYFTNCIPQMPIKYKNKMAIES